MKKKKGFLLLAAAAVIMTMLAGTSLYARGQLEQKAEAVKTEAHAQSRQEVEQRGPADTESVNAGEAQEVRSQSEENDGEHQEKMIIALDPGHQGPGIDMSGMEEDAPGSGVMKQKNNSGTTGRYTGLPEYQLNLDIALKVKERLSRLGYEVVMSRENNETAMSNQERARQANDSGAVLCVRIHANGSESPGSTGALCLVVSEENPYAGSLYGESSELAQDILEKYCEATGFENRGIQISDSMTGMNWSQIPVVILEMGFMTNEQEDTRMADPSFQEKMADGITQGIEQYCLKRKVR
ncbi:N-acetylmuramoyl-L-alanine amidase [Faecalicatena orotica]|uniref:N-acetylmuramoyl-L-alanine amidase n=1 Tax=Faecalicatena orotica TaxID=1544 RepID=UPI003217EAE8